MGKGKLTPTRRELAIINRVTGRVMAVVQALAAAGARGRVGRMQRVTVFYSGRVQGVGFRATVRHVSRGYDVTGIVRNLADGRVELVAEGMKEELQGFLEGIAKGELSSYIAARPETWGAATGGMRGFVIG